MRAIYQATVQKCFGSGVPAAAVFAKICFALGLELVASKISRPLCDGLPAHIAKARAGCLGALGLFFCSTCMKRRWFSS
jgi:hypothetical protein